MSGSQRDIFHTVVTSFLVFGLLTVQGVLLARILGPEKRGIYATVVFYTQTLTFIGLFGTQHAVARWAARRKRDTAVLMSVCGRLGVVTGLVTMVAVAGLSLWVLPAEKLYLAPLCIVCSLFLPLEHVRQLWLSVDHGLGRFKSYNANRLVAGVAFPVLLALAWLSGFHTVGAMIACFVVAPILGLLYRRATDPRREIETTAGRGPTVGRILERGRPYAAAVLAADLFERIDVFLFIWLASFTAQGYYAAAVPSANLLLVVPIAISLFAFRAGADRNKALTPKRLLWTSGAVLLVQILSAVAYAAVLKPLVLLVFGDSFGGAVPLTLALLPAYALAGCGRVAESYLQGPQPGALGGVLPAGRCRGAAGVCASFLRPLGGDEHPPGFGCRQRW